jgi:hypothetical protein
MGYLGYCIIIINCKPLTQMQENPLRLNTLMQKYKMIHGPIPGYKCLYV